MQRARSRSGAGRLALQVRITAEPGFRRMPRASRFNGPAPCCLCPDEKALARVDMGKGGPEGLDRARRGAGAEASRGATRNAAPLRAGREGHSGPAQPYRSNPGQSTGMRMRRMLRSRAASEATSPPPTALNLQLCRWSSFGNDNSLIARSRTDRMWARIFIFLSNP